MKMRQWMWTLLLSSTVATVGCGLTGGHNLPPASRLAHPGPGVGGPGPGVLPPPMPPVAQASAAMAMGAGSGVVTSDYVTGGYAGDYSSGGCSSGSCVDDGSGASASSPVQVLFTRPEAMQVQWDISGVGQFDSSPLITPGRQNFEQGAIYRLKLTNIPNREGVELYPTVEIGPPAYRSLAYLAHNAIPIQMTEEDFDQVLAGNFVTKVIYLPDPEFQGLAVADVATLVSTRLDPGLDPIEEAARKGTILAVVRMGNKDMETPGGGTNLGVIPASYSSYVGGEPCADCSTAGVGGAGAGHFGHRGCLSCLGHGQQRPDLTAGTMNLPPGGMPPGLIAGMNVPEYGMTMSGTPIGLPGPPHIPLGVPAGLQKHVMHNKTRMHIPDPVAKLKINVKQRPGQSYPHPVSRVNITEDTLHPSVHYGHHNYGAVGTGHIQNHTGHLPWGATAVQDPYCE